MVPEIIDLQRTRNQQKNVWSYAYPEQEWLKMMVRRDVHTIAQETLKHKGGCDHREVEQIEQ